MSRQFQFQSMYNAIPATGSSCGDCGGTLSQLSPRCMTNMPKFYVGRCGFIGEIGVGIVRKCKATKKAKAYFRERMAERGILIESAGTELVNGDER